MAVHSSCVPGGLSAGRGWMDPRTPASWGADLTQPQRGGTCSPRAYRESSRPLCDLEQVTFLSLCLRHTIKQRPGPRPRGMLRVRERVSYSGQREEPHGPERELRGWGWREESDAGSVPCLRGPLLSLDSGPHCPLTTRPALQNTRWTPSRCVPASCRGKGPSGRERTTCPSARRTAASSKATGATWPLGGGGLRVPFPPPPPALHPSPSSVY